MASKPRRRKFNLREVRATPAFDLLTLGAVTVKGGNITGAGVRFYRAMIAKFTWDLGGFTAGEGPITVGYAHSDYSTTEIKEAIEVITSIDLGDKIAQEQANRLVRIVGTFRAEANSDLNSGKPISTKLNWGIAVGDSVFVWAYNDSTTQLTTGGHVNLNGSLWVKDE